MGNRKTGWIEVNACMVEYEQFFSITFKLLKKKKNYEVKKKILEKKKNKELFLKARIF